MSDKVYQKEWYKKNKERLIPKYKEYRKNNKQKIKKAQHLWYLKHRKRLIEKSHKRFNEKKAIILSKQKEYYQTHKEQVSNTTRKYRLAYPEIYRKSRIKYLKLHPITLEYRNVHQWINR